MSRNKLYRPSYPTELVRYFAQCEQNGVLTYFPTLQEWGFQRGITLRTINGWASSMVINADGDEEEEFPLFAEAVELCHQFQGALAVKYGANDQIKSAMAKRLTDVFLGWYERNMESVATQVQTADDDSPKLIDLGMGDDDMWEIE